MRLLKYDEDGNLTVTPDVVDGSAIPPYAILSHTWGADTDEVTFEDIKRGLGEDKSGYRKIRFCGEQAKRDNLQYFWIDTCCINKENKAEHSLAIRSMFHWYRKATRCYVYLSDVPDVPGPPPGAEGKASLRSWDSDFRRSKWFTRGWTLQELLAPQDVEFFSQGGNKLGDRVSLKSQINEITAIPHAALEGCPLSQFRVSERLGWKEGRETKLKEDAAYSLSGLLGVEITPVYGEGAKEAFRRLHEEVGKQEACLRDLRVTDPRIDKKRIEDAKGGLLEDSYRWVLDNSMFQQWHHDSQSQLLWIKGDPGKGKTMLLCGIINELQKTSSRDMSVSYFFCQATDSRINSATAVLRGLLYLLVGQQTTTITHIRKIYDEAGKSVFEDVNAWLTLTEAFADMLQDPGLGKTCIIIDALDECVTDLPKLLRFIARHSSKSPHIKWIVSSRNLPHIEEELAPAKHGVRLSLELNAESVSVAVGAFIRHKVSQLAQQNDYDKQTHDTVFEQLTLKANDTFLWVALVCQELWQTKRRNALRKLLSFPPGLNALYERMMQQMQASEDGELCRQVLAVIAVVYRPITLDELVVLVEPLEDLTGERELQDIIEHCGSFLTLRKGAVRLVHQSAQDFLVTNASHEIFPGGIEAAHLAVSTRSLAVLCRTLHRDLYQLEAPGITIDDIRPPSPDPLAAIYYACLYWIDHLCQSEPKLGPNITDAQDVTKLINNFFESKYLYWLEALSLCKSMAKGAVMMSRLQSLVQILQREEITKLVHDAHRFIRYHKRAIESYPLQTYASALLFSPTGSATRRCFDHEEPKEVIIKPLMSEDWGACLQILGGHNEIVRSVAFSRDSTKLLSVSDKCIKIWNASSGECVKTLTSEENKFQCAAFSHNSTILVSASGQQIKTWDYVSGEYLQTYFGHLDIVQLATVSQDSSKLASVSRYGIVKLWDAVSGECLRTFSTYTHPVISATFSLDSKTLASASHDTNVKLWDVGSGRLLHTFEGHDHRVTSMAFSHDLLRLASGSIYGEFKIWDVRSGACAQTFQHDDGPVTCVAWSPDSAQLASGSLTSTICMWDVSSGICLQILRGHTHSVTSLSFSHDGLHLVSSSWDTAIRIWDTGFSTAHQTLEHHSDFIYSMDFSSDLSWLATGSIDAPIMIWDVSSGKCLQTLENHGTSVRHVTFLQGSARLASADSGGGIKIWDTCRGSCLLNLEDSIGHHVTSIAASHRPAQLVSIPQSLDSVRLWDTRNGAVLQEFAVEEHIQHFSPLAISRDSSYLAAASGTNEVIIWNTKSGMRIHRLNTFEARVYSLAFSVEVPTKLASASSDTTGSTVMLWDVVSGICLRIIKILGLVDYLHFSHDSTHLETDRGMIPIQSVEPHSEPIEPVYVGTNLDQDRSWIRYGDSRVVWIPPEFRSHQSSVRGNVAAVTCETGRVWFCSVDPRGIR